MFLNHKIENHPLQLVILWGCLGMFSVSAGADNSESRFIDPCDGKLDVSEWVLEDRGFLPVPIIITEPAVGYGGGAALMFFHKQMQEKTTTTGDAVYGLPPSITGVGGVATENGTWAAFLFHSGSWRQDRIRYQGALAKPSVNLTFYGGGGSPSFSDGLDYNLDGWVTDHSLLFRVKDSDWFLGGETLLFDTTSSFDFQGDISGVGPREMDFTAFGLGPVVRYDSRDNMFTPNRGMQIDYSTLFNTSSTSIRDDQNYQNTSVQGIFYVPHQEQWVLGCRIRGAYASGDVPFFSLPFISMRGIPAMRYQGNALAQGELEFRYNLDPRWSVLGFGGIGKVADSFGDFSGANLEYAAGAGFRYLMARKMGLHTGIDIARGPEEWTFYIIVGSAWSL